MTATYKTGTDVKNETEYLTNLIASGGASSGWAKDQLGALATYSNSQQNSTSGTASSGTQQPNNSLRAVASNLGYGVGYDDKTGQVTVSNPTSGKNIAFASGQGSEYGLGGLQGSNNIVSDIDALMAALSGKTKITPAALISGGIDMTALLNSIKQSTNVDYSAIYKQMTDAAKNSRKEVAPVLSWEEAQSRSSAKLNPLYDERMKNVMGATDTGLVKRGFYGQLPGEVVRQETAMTEENARASAIAGMADSMVGQSQNTATANEQMNMQRESQAMQQLMNALDYASSRNDANTSQIWNLVNYLTGREDNEFNKNIASANLTGVFNGGQTLAGRSTDMSIDATKAGLTGEYAGNPTYQAGQDTITNQQRAEQDAIANRQRDRALNLDAAQLNYQKDKDAATTGTWDKQAIVSSAVKQIDAQASLAEKAAWLESNKSYLFSQPDGVAIYNTLYAYITPKGAAGGPPPRTIYD